MNDTIVTTKTIADIPEIINKSFKDALSKNIPATAIPNFKQVISDERNNQLIQEKERKRRSTNIIIHGVEEKTENVSESDEKYIKDLMYHLGVSIKPESITRLGINDNAKKGRPIKVRFVNEKEKSKVMSHLSNLKKAEEKFRQISITDDFTMEERKEIKRFVDEAKSKNETEQGNFFWRVRGSPKTGLQLRRVQKKTKQ